MKLFGSRSYVDAPPAPKMPPGLMELMEGLTKEVLKNNPTEVYKFCAEHMKKMLELRDHNTPKQCLTLEQKVLKANTIIRQRAEQRRQKYDNDMQMLQQNGQVTDTSEKKSFDTEYDLSMKAEKTLLNDNLKSDDVYLNNNAVTTSENIEHKETNEVFNDKIIISKVYDDDYSRGNEQQVKSKYQMNKSIDNRPIHSVPYEVSENTNEEIKSTIATVANDHTKEEYLKKIVADEKHDVNKENAQVKVNQHGDIENQSKDKNDCVNDEFADKKDNDKCEGEENDKFSRTIGTDQNSQTEVDQKCDSSDENDQKEINENTVVIDENNQEEIEEPITNEGEKNENKYDLGINVEHNQKNIEEQPVTNEKGDQIEIKEELAINYKNIKNELEEQPITNDESNQNEIKEGVVINIENNQKNIEEQPVTNGQGDQIKIKEKATINDTNVKNEIDEQPVTNEESNENETKEEVVINNQKEIEQQSGTDKKGDRNEINEEAAITGENNQKEDEEQSVTNDEGVLKEIEEQVLINNKSDQKESAVIRQENDLTNLKEQANTNDEINRIEMEDQINPNYQNGQEKIKEHGDMKLISQVKTEKGQSVIDKHLGDEIVKTIENDESIITINEAKSDESVSNQDKTVFESVEDISTDKRNDELNVVKDDGIICDPENDKDVTNILILCNKEPELASVHAVPNTSIDSNNEHVQIKAEPIHPNQLQTPISENNFVNVSGIKTESGVDEVIDKPLIINIDFQQNNQDTLIGHTDQSKDQNINNYNENVVIFKESGTVESKNSKPMDLETAAITIQKVFRNFLFRSKTSSFDDSSNIEFNIFDHDSNSKDTVYSNQSQILNKDKRPIGLSRMDTVLQTVNEEKSLSLSTDDSSTLSSAATVIQAHIRGFLVRKRLNRNKTISSTSLADSDDPPASFETDPDPAKSKTVLNIHIVPEGSHFLSRDESMLTSVELSLDGSPPASSNLHPLGYDKSERRKQLKREDAFQSISPPSNNSTRLSEEHDSVKEVLLNNDKNVAHESVNDEMPGDTTISEDSDSDDVLSKGTVEEKQIENQDLATTSDKKAIVVTASSDELDVITPFETVEGKNNRDLDGNKLVHSGEFHDVVLPTKVSRNDTSVVRGE